MKHKQKGETERDPVENARTAVKPYSYTFAGKNKLGPRASTEVVIDPAPRSSVHDFAPPQAMKETDKMVARALITSGYKPVTKSESLRDSPDDPLNRTFDTINDGSAANLSHQRITSRRMDQVASLKMSQKFGISPSSPSFGNGSPVTSPINTNRSARSDEEKGTPEN